MKYLDAASTQQRASPVTPSSQMTMLAHLLSQAKKTLVSPGQLVFHQ